MKKIKLSFICCAVLFLQVYAFSQSESNIFGKVVDEETNEGVAGAYIYISDIQVIDASGVYGPNPFFCNSDKNGNFKIQNVPVGDDAFENELIIRYENISKDVLSSKYYSQQYVIKIRLTIGKNLFLKPIKLKKGCSVHGNVKLWDGTIINNAKISFTALDTETFYPYICWTAFLNSDSSFYSEPIPYEKDLKMDVKYVNDPAKKESYGCFSKIINIAKTGNNNIEIIIPYRNTSVTGKILGKDRMPISGQDIQIFNGECDTETTSDQNGNFIFKSFEPGVVDMMISYKKLGILKNYFIKQTTINNDEALKFEIVADSDYFDYKLVREKIQGKVQ